MRILVVEDEHRIADTVRKGLMQEGYATDVAYDGTEGYDLAATEEYDIILLDVMLPGMSGIEICRMLRKERNHTPILLLTAKGQTADKVAGLDAGADDYLAKPFAFEELLARIRALLRRPAPLLQTTITFKDLSINSQTFVCQRDGIVITLSSKEFALMEYLMRNAGTVVTKDKIISHVWDYDADILPNTVEVYIRNLRAKVDDPFPRKKAQIKTVRGFGYTIS